MIMSQPLRMLLALVAGLVAGIALHAVGAPPAPVNVAEVVGGLWLDALRMTIVPLVVALLVTGIAEGTEAARANRLALRSVLLFLVMLGASALLGALLLLPIAPEDYYLAQGLLEVDGPGLHPVHEHAEVVDPEQVPATQRLRSAGQLVRGHATDGGAGDHRANAGAGPDRGPDAALLQGLEHSDVRKPLDAATTQHEADPATRCSFSV